MREKEISPSKDVVSQQALEMLKTLGLNLYERKLYVCLLSRGTATAGELADFSGVPRARVYDVLTSLADKGFVMVQQSKPMKYIPVSPKEALERASKNILEKAQKMVEHIKNLKESEVVEELEKIYKDGLSKEDESELISMIKGRFVIDNHEQYLLRNAQKSIDIMVSEEGLKDIYRKYLPLLKEAFEKGIKIRIIAPITESNKIAYEALSEIAEIRDANKLQGKIPYTKLSIMDNKEALLHLTHDAEKHPVSQSSIWTASNHFVKNFASKTFDLLWEMLNDEEEGN